MYDWNAHDNDIAYSYDDYVSNEKNSEDEELEQSDYDYEQYQEDMINLLYNQINN